MFTQFSLWQLHRRAKILNSDFQARVFDVVARHSVNIAISDEAHGIRWHENLLWPSEPLQHNLDSSISNQAQDDKKPCRIPSLPPTLEASFLGDNCDTFGRLQSLDVICSAQYVVTATIIEESRAVLDPPRLGTVGSLFQSGSIQRHTNAKDLEDSEIQVSDPTYSSPEFLQARATSSWSASSFLGGRTNSTVSSCTLTVPEIMCQFRGGVSPVWVSPAQAKTVARMTEKTKEYLADGAPWPMAACILDPVRASVVCQGAAQILEVAEWFLMSHQATGQQPFPVCRIKNKFALSSNELVRVGGTAIMM
jgi:hypothetical protein